MRPCAANNALDLIRTYSGSPNLDNNRAKCARRELRAPETIGMIEQRVRSDAADLALVGTAVRVLEFRENESFLSKRELALIPTACALTAAFHGTSR